MGVFASVHEETFWTRVSGPIGAKSHEHGTKEHGSDKPFGKLFVETVTHEKS
jgi:hypothetical protein